MAVDAAVAAAAADVAAAAADVAAVDAIPRLPDPPLVVSNKAGSPSCQIDRHGQQQPTKTMGKVGEREKKKKKFNENDATAPWVRIPR